MNRSPALKYILTAVVLGSLFIFAMKYFAQLSIQEIKEADSPSEVVIENGKIYPTDVPKGAYLLLDVDMEFAISRFLDIYHYGFLKHLHDKEIKNTGLRRFRSPDHFVIEFKTAELRDLARENLKQAYSNQFKFTDEKADKGASLKATLTKETIIATRQQILEKNITVLRNRVRELGITKSIIKKQGLNQIVVQLPSIQDPTQAKEIFATSSTLEFRLVNEEADAFKVQAGGIVPRGAKLYKERSGSPILLKRHVLLTGKNIARASAGFDTIQQPSINITLDKEGTKLIANATRTNVAKLIAIVLIVYKTDVKKLENGSLKKEITTTTQVISVARIQEELGKRFQITGLESRKEAYDLAQSLNTGALAAPVYIIEEHIISGEAK
ncbi:MAG: hypothetical protein L3J51_03270 [Cocleimonas sp.]|nr:hypothetical protein [Cocleimonas sp.]